MLARKTGQELSRRKAKLSSDMAQFCRGVIGMKKENEKAEYWSPIGAIKRVIGEKIQAIVSQIPCLCLPVPTQRVARIRLPHVQGPTGQTSKMPSQSSASNTLKKLFDSHDSALM